MFDEYKNAISLMREYRTKAAYNKRNAELLEDTKFIYVFEQEIKSLDLTIEILEEKLYQEENR